MIRQAPSSQQSPTRFGRHEHRWWRSLVPLLLVIGTGCTPIPYLPEEATPVEPVAPTEEVAVVSHQAATDLQPSEPMPDETRPTARQLQPLKSRVLVLRSSDAENYRDVATALARELSTRYELHEIDLSDPGIREAAARADSSAWSAAIAIGEDAAEFAANELDVVTVFCQIFDYGPLLDTHQHLFGVEPLPPLKLQLESWQQLSPNASSIGLIVSHDKTDLVEEAKAVAAELGIELRASFAVTDQDAIYQFKRFAQTVDGLWLYPSREILSPGSIREILDYALVHQVQTIVFNKSLLDWGALLSVGSNTDDVAASAAAMVDELVRGDRTGVGRMKPLTTVETHLNEETAEKLGIAGSAPADQDDQLLTAIENDS
jgi:hypothetical protein